MVCWQLLGNFVLMKKIQKLKRGAQGWVCSSCCTVSAGADHLQHSWKEKTHQKAYLMTGRFQNALQKGKVSLFPIYSKIIHNQASSLLCKWPLCRSPWKSRWVKEKPRDHAEEEHCAEVQTKWCIFPCYLWGSCVMISWVSVNRKMPAGGWVTVLFSFFFNGVRKKKLHTEY